MLVCLRWQISTRIFYNHKADINETVNLENTVLTMVRFSMLEIRGWDIGTIFFHFLKSIIYSGLMLPSLFLTTTIGAAYWFE